MLGRTKVAMISIEKLVVSKANVRKHGIDKQRLKDSISKEGVLEPIHVWHNSETEFYEIMQGQHRYLGALEVGVKELECVIHSNIGSLEDAKRWCRKQACLQEELGPLDKLQIAKDLKEQYGSLREGCKQEGLPYSKLYDWYSLRKLSPEVTKYISSEISDCPKFNLPLRKLKEIARLPKDKQLDFAREIEGLSDLQTRRVLREAKGLADSLPVLIELSSKTCDVLKEKARLDNLHLEQYCARILGEFAQDD